MGVDEAHNEERYVSIPLTMDPGACRPVSEKVAQGDKRRLAVMTGSKPPSWRQDARSLPKASEVIWVVHPLNISASTIHAVPRPLRQRLTLTTCDESALPRSGTEAFGRLTHALTLATVASTAATNCLELNMVVWIVKKRDPS